MLPDLLAMLIDGGERDTQRTVVVQIPAPYHGDVLRNAQPRFQNRVHGADRQRIVIAEDTVQHGRLLKESSHGMGTLERFCIDGEPGSDIAVGIGKASAQ